jgi:beta-glucanase (GH16 family)
VPADTEDSVGFWPAFWTLPSSISWPPEIDIFEFYGGSSTGSSGEMTLGSDGFLHPQRFSSNLHRADRSTAGMSFYGTGGPGSVLWDKDFHVWGLDWRASHLDVWVDGSLAWHYTGGGIPSVPMYPLLNLAIRDNYVAETTAEAHQSMLVDWVRIWS